MRKLLAREEGDRKRFQGVFSRFGKKNNFKGYSEPTLLLLNIIDQETNLPVADHIWFAYTKTFEKIKLEPGLRIGFEARIKIYKKGYVNRKYAIDNRKSDFKLSHPTKITILG
ncbi:MAG: hypothetical protein ABIR06_05555 [Cyclobacteriaceae bacterium]